MRGIVELFLAVILIFLIIWITVLKSPEVRPTSVHISAKSMEVAIKGCEANGGLIAVVYENTYKEYESCGYRCSGASGFYSSSFNSLCSNGNIIKSSINSYDQSSRSLIGFPSEQDYKNHNLNPELFDY